MPRCPYPCPDAQFLGIHCQAGHNWASHGIRGPWSWASWAAVSIVGKAGQLWALCLGQPVFGQHWASWVSYISGQSWAVLGILGVQSLGNPGHHGSIWAALGNFEHLINLGKFKLI